MNTGIAERKAKDFIDNLMDSFTELKRVYENLGVNLDDSLPNVFKEFKETEVRVIYYSVPKVFLFILESGKSGNYSFHYEKNSRGILPFIHIEGEFTEVTFSGTSFDLGYGVKINFEYALVLGEASLKERNKNTLKLANEISSTSYNFQKYNNEASENERGKHSYIQSLKEIASNFLKLIYDNTVGELTIDKFLENNPVILTESLNLTNLKHQIELKNLLSKYAHDLKPDLIAFDIFEKKWTIIDYKKANKNLIKNIDKTRTGLKAEVHSLKDQLNDYVEYFDEYEHRKYVEERYGVQVNHPIGIGIIGKVEDEIQNDFNRILKSEPRWFKIIPYNYLYDNFINYIESGNKFIQDDNHIDAI
ncbi:hypothetical protein [Ornithinibacillus halotolerans]|uniref:Uncharacterized protein n=1 Tax=Ornithinibacillus halotolerans TaxID=1274357 RepID=A0A916SDN3_9BACI|nr:hypothetical protein [Ornithinibacillus halotolerans]GGA91709.1 hypothetical protein GCM10008025_37740 [Ornithinibacillus halotolerans]